MAKALAASRNMVSSSLSWLAKSNGSCQLKLAKPGLCFGLKGGVLAVMFIGMLIFQGIQFVPNNAYML